MHSGWTMFELLRQPDIRRLAGARFIGRVGGEAAFLVGIWGFAAYRFRATAWQIALVMVCLGIAAMVGAMAGSSDLKLFHLDDIAAHCARLKNIAPQDR